ncbi:unnamed protein product [Schistosoma curassoni]|uniref:FLYWCH-type domain-containing protein n=1 Tax=Schistosoma curassoni TaxID=6186 RepID=A0A183K602_9TREM|nr:unnamed protein product [Schistosoma curassoni]
MSSHRYKFRNCQSKFRVRLEEQGYVIKSYNMLHNHPCSNSWMVCDPWTRRLSSEEKENLKPVILHGESVDEVIESIKERAGKRRTLTDRRKRHHKPLRTLMDSYNSEKQQISRAIQNRT